MTDRVAALNHHTDRLLGKTTVPAGASLMPWNELAAALRRSGDIQEGEALLCFIVAENGLWVVTDRSSDKSEG